MGDRLLWGPDWLWGSGVQPGKNGLRGVNLCIYSRQSTCFFGVAVENAAATINHEPDTDYD